MIASLQLTTPPEPNAIRSLHQGPDVMTVPDQLLAVSYIIHPHPRAGLQDNMNEHLYVPSDLIL